MSLPASGTITLGQVNVELGRASTAAINMNEAVVRFTFNVPSGAIAMSNGYGKSASFALGIFYAGLDVQLFETNRVTRINSTGALVGSETNVGTARNRLAGAAVGGNGLFYGGENATGTIVTRINSSGALVGSETNVGTSINGTGAASVGGNGMFYGGMDGPRRNRVTRINSTGALVGSQTSVGTARERLAGAAVGGNGLFYGGTTGVFVNTVTRINSSGALVGSETSAGTVQSDLGGAPVAGIGLFYAGDSNNTVTRINSTGALVGSETSVGTVRRAVAGAPVGGNGLFYAGIFDSGYNFNVLNTVTRINSTGALVGSETNVGTIRYALGGAGAL